MSAFTKDPDAVLDYKVDWSEWLPSGDTITASTWISSDPTVLVIDADTFTTTTATVWLSGGEVRRKYTVTNRITTDGGRTDDRSITIRIAEK